MNSSRECVVDESLSQERLDAYLHKKYPEYSRTKLKQLIETGAISVNGKLIKRAATQVQVGDRIIFEPPLVSSNTLKAVKLSFEILFEDEHLLVINKPAGLVVHPGAGNREQTLVNGLIERYGNDFNIGSKERPGIVHRLDKDTSGLMMVARSELAYQTLIKQFAAREVNRTYLAITARLPKGAGTIDAAIARDPNRRTRMAVVKKNGKTAITHWKEVERLKFGSLLELKLETGRTHQIRVHLKQASAPILGDAVYGESIKQIPNNFRKAVQALGRQALHAQALEFEHPIIKTKLQFKSELPSDMQQLLSALRGN